MLGRIGKLKLRLRGARFAIVREAGTTRLAFGSVTPGFLSACADVLERAGIESAWVAEVGGKVDARLEFSDNVPAGVRQRIRNVWTPPPGPGREGAAVRR